MPRATLALARLAARGGELGRAVELVAAADHLLVSGGGAWCDFDGALRAGLALVLAGTTGAVTWRVLVEGHRHDDEVVAELVALARSMAPRCAEAAA